MDIFILESNQVTIVLIRHNYYDARIGRTVQLLLLPRGYLRILQEDHEYQGSKDVIHTVRETF